jgi:hypothetical protein
MSEQEFDLYLKLLAKCLRLTSGQREQIADELRDHLEERLEELARAGVPREKAVVQALDEFGDAAVLAAHFTTIARLKRRRFLMRLSLGSVGALTAALLIAFAFWPDNRAVRGPEKTVAQEKPKAPLSEPTKRPPAVAPRSVGKAAETTSDRDEIAKLKRERERLENRVTNLEKIREGLRSRVDNPGKEIASLREKVKTLQDELQRLAVEAKARPLSSDVFQGSKVEARIAEALSQPVDFNIEPQPLQDALEFIAARYQIPIIIDRKSLKDAAFDPKKENVALSVPGIPMRDLLELLLNQASPGLAYEVRRGVLTVSTIDKITGQTDVVVYDCRDLIDVGTQDQCASVAQTNSANERLFQFSPETTKAPTAQNTPPVGLPGGASSSSPMKASENPAQNAVDNGIPQTLSRLPLIRTLVAATGPEAWNRESQATISEFGGLLVVRQNPLVQEQIRRALADIRQMRAHGAFASLGNPCEPEGAKRSGERPQTHTEGPLRPPTLGPTPASTWAPSSPTPVPKQRGSGL